MHPIHLQSQAWQLAVVIGTFLAGVHAFRKLSPYFAITWFGSGLVLGWFWTEHRGAPEALLLPALVIYIAAAVSKGIVERGTFTGNHIVHVIATGLFTGLIALPLETAADAMRWITPRGAPAVTHGHVKPEWLGGGSADLAVQWAVLGFIYYTLYKILDHIGLGSVLQTVLLFAAMPFLPRLVEAVLRVFG